MVIKIMTSIRYLLFECKNNVIISIRKRGKPMKQVLIIPDVNNIEETLKLAAQYNLGFEYNDFFLPDILDDKDKLESVCANYKQYDLPNYCTMHGAFFDVIPFSPDKRIREISLLRINQSLDVARKLGVKAVVFHTNYNPFLNSKAYVEGFIKQNIKLWNDILQQNQDINIYLENMFDTTPDIMEAMAEGLSSNNNFGICLDYAHAALSKVAPEKWARALGTYIKHVHINDNDLISDLHLAWGDGVINRGVFYEAYHKYMSQATVLIETSAHENKVKSLEVLAREGFLE